MRFSSAVMRAVGGIAKHPRRVQRDTTRRLFKPNLQNTMSNTTQRRTKNRRLTEESSQHQWQDERQDHATNKAQINKCVRPPCPRNSMLACAWRSRRCVVYVFRLTSPCDRFLQPNIEHKGQGEHTTHTAHGVRTCADVANFLPSTVSLNVLKDPWHMRRRERNQLPELWVCVCGMHDCVRVCGMP